jgi:hypothetical protein
VPLENAPNVECSGSEAGGEVKRMVGKPYTLKRVDLLTTQVFRLKVISTTLTSGRDEFSSS